MPKFHPGVPQVAVLLESSHGASRNRLRGIFQYARLYGPWGLRMITGGPSDQQMPDIRRWKGNGVIARNPDEKTSRMILDSKLPLVLIDPPYIDQDPDHPLAGCSRVVLNNHKIGQIAARYFLDKQFESFAFFGRWSNDSWSRIRQQSYSEALGLAGYECRHFIPATYYDDPLWEKERQRMIRWLQSLPRQTALFCASDLEGQLAIDACLASDINVPFEIAVLGVGDDDLFCESCFPSMSSISIAWREGGFLAAKLLDQKMRNKKSPPEAVVYDPISVVSRSSTDAIRITDKLVIRAIDFIRSRNGFGIRVSDVAKQFGVTRQWIERRFKETLGIPAIDLIKQARMKQIRFLVIESDLPFHEIAKMSGFESGNYMRELFKQEFGTSMSQYRKSHQRASEFQINTVQK